MLSNFCSLNLQDNNENFNSADSKYRLLTMEIILSEYKVIWSILMVGILSCFWIFDHCRTRYFELLTSQY